MDDRTSVRKNVEHNSELAIGLERITALLLDIDNVRKMTLIPRDRTRLVHSE